ncbi:PilZ domain-containing protein [Campylobacter canadensis]|uniref:PilZ domain-containing protein n=1 Tax=Campylobacter canadensis TaxID=449520 RepID=A0ABS7WRE3_9BACT|nr:PilZ domain-containing protein [Campylobacter canadensis]MBZ7986907.1 PilZ domain-containing protein [Campylobacter canadensis]MBZ7997944.1 PilZ domain-containing protein [Campylobacter canadensis]
MSFTGREELVNHIDYFEKYSKKFLTNIEDTCRCSGVFLDNDAIEVYEELYNMLLTKDFDTQKAKEIIKHKDFNKATFFEFLIVAQIDFNKYLMQKNLDFKYGAYLSFAIERYAGIFCNIHYNKTQTPSSINVFSANSNSGFFIHENFIDTFKKIEQIGEKLEFLNLFDGVPVRTFGDIIKIEDNQVTVKLDLMQILSMKEEGNAYIIANQYLQKNIKANIVATDFVKCEVTLNSFETQPFMHALKRKYPRVHPNEFTKIALKHEDGRVVNGKLFDISEGGIGVVSNEDIGFKNGDILSSQIVLHMPSTNESVELKLNFKLVVLIVYQNAFRYCLEILPNQADASKIQEFATLREQETLRELKDKLSLYKRD